MARDRSAAAITAVGVCSSLGDFVTACAASRAGVSRPLDITDPMTVPSDPDPEDEVPVVVAHPVRELASFRGMGRLVALVAQALVVLRPRLDPTVVGAVESRAEAGASEAV